MKFFESFLKPHQELIAVKYFSAVQTRPDKARRQELFFSANKINPKFQLHLGKYVKKQLTCRKCRDVINQFEEKETDVRIATQMLSDVITNKCDITILVSADSDLIPPIEAINEFNPLHKVWVFFPPKRYSNDLVNLSIRYIKLERHPERFQNALLPDQVTTKNNYVLIKPDHWK